MWITPLMLWISVLDYEGPEPYGEGPRPERMLYRTKMAGPPKKGPAFRFV